MAKYFIILFVFLSITVQAQTKEIIHLKESSHDFGDVKQGEVVDWLIEFENRGLDTVVIEDVRTTCGCTIPQWDTMAVYPPACKGKIKIALDTKGKQGVYNKNVIILYNQGQMITIPIRANILKKKIKSSYR